jgi:hypothetical protein
VRLIVLRACRCSSEQRSDRYCILHQFLQSSPTQLAMSLASSTASLPLRFK